MLFLYKPHVTGAEGQVTSPDVIVDRAFVDETQVSLGRLTQESWVQSADGVTGRAGYGVMALGGGALILPVVILSDGTVSLSRKAWRLHAVQERAGPLALNGTSLTQVGPPEQVVEAVGGSGDALPRGYLAVQTAEAETWRATLQSGDDTLTHEVHPEPLGQDRWGDARPRPRYSVGPTQRDVTHYI